jgi:WD40 repeat protein
VQLATGAEDALIKLTVLPDEMKANINHATVELRGGCRPRAARWRAYPHARHWPHAGHSKKIAGLAFHPVADNVLASSAFDHTVRVWDVQVRAPSPP